MGREDDLKAEKSQKLKAQKPEFEKVYNEFYPALCYFARRLIANHDGPTAEDIVTEIFLKYRDKQVQFETVYNVKAFLYISTRNACINHNKNVAYQLGILEKIQLTGEFAWVSLNEQVYKDVVDLIFNLINELPEKCKLVMILLFSKGKETWQVADQMNISKHTVRNQKTRAIQLIKESGNFEHIKQLYESLYEQSLECPTRCIPIN